jgi:hypothetical protein
VSGRHGYPERPVRLVLSRAHTRMLIASSKNNAAAAPNRLERAAWEQINRALWRALDKARAETAAEIKARRSA